MEAGAWQGCSLALGRVVSKWDLIGVQRSAARLKSCIRKGCIQAGLSVWSSAARLESCIREGCIQVGLSVWRSAARLESCVREGYIQAGLSVWWSASKRGSVFGGQQQGLSLALGRALSKQDSVLVSVFCL